MKLALFIKIITLKKAVVLYFMATAFLYNDVGNKSIYSCEYITETRNFLFNKKIIPI